MKNPLDKDDFEFYLEQEVNQHRMYPSDHIWRNIQQDIHGYKKWPALTVITLFVISALVVGTILIKPQHQLVVLAASTTAQKAAATEVEVKQQPAENMQEHFSPEHITQQTIARVAHDIDITDNIQTALSAYNNNIQDFIPAGNTTAYVEPVYTSGISAGNNDVASSFTAATEQKTAANKKDAQPASNQVKNTPVFANLINLVPNEDILYGSMLKLPKSNKTRVHNGFMFSIFEKIEPSSPYVGLTLDNNFSAPVHNPFKFKPRNPRLEFSFYAAPSISYRRLSYGTQGTANHTYISGLPYNAGYTVDLGRAARNKPATGYEVGALLGYKLNSVLTLRGGLQFNMREYDIEAYKVSNQAQSSSFMPTGNGNSSSLGGGNVSSQNSASLNGNDRITLQNRYYQIAVPLGLDVRAWKSGRFAVGIATSIQPTYIFDKDPFIITSDYKNYIDGSKLVRNWNVNTALETYLSYSTGKFKWQIGPQFRYQVLSTLSGSYPIREHLLDYGVKIGIVKSLR